ncbi:MAG: hypothetical protein ACTSPY_18515, partial [Candidatus Helarchaeota archaeon]
RTYFNEIILMPKDKFLNISLAPIFGRLGTKIMIFNPKNIKILKKIDPNIISIIGNENEIPKKFDENLKDITNNIFRILRPPKERVIIYQMLFLTKYIVNKLILREFIDPDDSEYELFLEKMKSSKEDLIEKYVKQFNILNYEQLHLAETAVNGPHSIILTTFSDENWHNAAIGANYSKGKNTVCYLIEDISENNKHQIANLLKSIDNNLLNYNTLLNNSEELGNIIIENILRIALDFAEHIILFPIDASFPFELIFYPGRLGLESISTKYCIGRILGDDIFDTCFLATSSINFSLQSHSMSKILIVGNPTGDLEYSFIESAGIAFFYERIHIPYAFLAGGAIPDSIFENLKKTAKKFNTTIDFNKFKNLELANKKNFTEKLVESHIIHFSGSPRN